MNLPKHIEENWIEILADMEHDRWSKWQKYLHGLCVDVEIVAPESEMMRCDGKAFPKMLFNRWERQIKTKYKDLTEREKESDRKEARNTLSFIAQILEEEKERLMGEIEKRESPCLCSNLIRCNCEIRKAHEIAKIDIINLIKK